MLKVTCAIIEANNKTLVVQRSEEMKLPEKWEFPGGKIEPGETEEECLIREIKEELNINIDVIQRLKPSTFHYPNQSIQLIPFIANYSEGELKLAEHKNFKWLSKEDLLHLDWAEADIPIVKEYIDL
jgi:8-oxo-dGTP diphosphatase